MKSCVIYNPRAGRGRAARWEAELRNRVPEGTHFLPTESSGHAIELARKAAEDGFEFIIAAGGDGTVGEVANGVLRANRDVTFAVIPIGSANDYAFTLGIQRWWNEGRGWQELAPLEVDVGRIRAAGRERFFVNGCGIGFNGMVTVEAQKTRWLRGVPLYSWAMLKALYRHFQTPQLSIHFDGKLVERPTLVLSLNLAQREGGFPLTAAAILDDSLFDWLHVADVKRWELIRYLPAMISGKLPSDHPKLTAGRAAKVSVNSEAALCVHTDGELFAIREDGLREFEIELLPRRLRVLTYPPARYDGRTARGS